MKRFSLLLLSGLLLACLFECGKGMEKRRLHARNIKEGFHYLRISVPREKKYNHVAELCVDSGGTPCSWRVSPRKESAGDLDLYIKVFPGGYVLRERDGESKLNWKNSRWRPAEGTVEFGGLVMKGTTRKGAEPAPDFRKLAHGEIGLIVHPFLWTEETPPSTDFLVDMLRKESGWFRATINNAAPAARGEAADGAPKSAALFNHDRLPETIAKYAPLWLFADGVAAGRNQQLYTNFLSTPADRRTARHFLGWAAPGKKQPDPVFAEEH